MRDIHVGLLNKMPTKRDAKPQLGSRWPKHAMNRNWKLVQGNDPCKGCNSPGGGVNQIHYRKQFHNLPICRICWYKMLNGDVELATRIIIQQGSKFRVQPMSTNRTTVRQILELPTKGIENAFWIRCQCNAEFFTKPFTPASEPNAWDQYVSHSLAGSGHMVDDWNDRNPHRAKNKQGKGKI